MTKARFTTPVMRLLQGSVDEAQTKDMQGRPRVVKSGPNAGQPNPQYYIGAAIAKTDPACAAFLLEVATKAAADFPALFPNGVQMGAPAFGCIRPDFAFKIIDGDSTGYSQSTPPKRWCDYENFPGHYIVRFASSYPPRCFHAGKYAAHEQIQEKNVIRRGYFIRVSGSMEGNGDQQKPGLYLNLDMVELAAYGEEIVSGPDAAAAFGAAPAALPPGATAAPVTPPSPAPQAPAAPLAAPPAAVAPPSPAAASPVPASPPAQPYTGYMDPEAAAAAQAAFPTPAAPAAVPPAPAPTPPSLPTAPVLTAKAGGATYESMIAAGWTDDTLRAHGYLA